MNIHLLKTFLFFFLFLFLPELFYPQEKQQSQLLTKADSLMQSGNYESAIDKFKEFLDDPGITKTNNAEQLALCYNSIAVCYYQLDNYTAAIEWFLMDLEVQRQRGDLESIATTMNNIGLNYKMRGNYDKAIEYYEQTVEIDEQMGKGSEIAKTLNNIGMVYRIWGIYAKAIEFFERSLQIRKSLNDQAGIAKTLNNIGLVYTDWKKFDQAVVSLKESLRIEETLNNESETGIRLNNLGRVYFMMNTYDTALVYFGKALEIHRHLQDKDQIALAYNNIGKVFLAMKKNENAEKYLLSALQIYSDLDLEAEKATVMANLSDISKASGNYGKSILMLDSSTIIAEKLNLRNQLQQNYLSYSNYYADRKDYKQSLEYFRKYSNIKDSVFSKEVLSQLSDFQVRYETEKKESEITLLKQNEEIQNLALKKQTVVRNSFIAVSVLLLALVGMSFYFLQVKKKDNRIIAGAREKSEQLLLNILPAGIASDLKERGQTEPKVFSDVTACFIDIVNFTQKSTQISPVVLISELNQIFTAFDIIVEKYGCERIKTIGDSYMAVAGLPDYNPRHAVKIVRCCIEMIRYIRERNLNAEHKWEIRAGIHSGEVIAGVVGVKKYIYDVFGDTINTASRMESNSEPMKINISEATYNLVKDDFETEYRGELEVRGKGKLRMYFVKV